MLISKVYFSNSFHLVRILVWKNSRIHCHHDVTSLGQCKFWARNPPGWQPSKSIEIRTNLPSNWQQQLCVSGLSSHQSVITLGECLCWKLRTRTSHAIDRLEMSIYKCQKPLNISRPPRPFARHGFHCSTDSTLLGSTFSTHNTSTADAHRSTMFVSSISNTEN